MKMNKEIAMKTKAAKMPPRMVDAMTFSAMQPKSVCTCGHTGDGANAQHQGFGGHGACQATPPDGINECQCGQFSWRGWTPEYRRFMADKGHEVK